MVVGVVRADHGDIYYSLHLKKKNNNVSMVSGNSFTDIDALKKGININIPVILCIDGKGILNKKTDPKNETDIAWKKNLDFNAIYYTEYIANNLTFLTFARKKMIDDQIVIFQGIGLQAIDFYLGPLPAALLQVVIKQENISSNETDLVFKESVLTDVVKSNDAKVQNYLIGEASLSRYHISLYGAAIHFFTKQNTIKKNSAEGVKPADILYKKAFAYMGSGMLVLFFISLLSSYIAIQYYSDKNLVLNQENVYLSQNYQRVISLENQKEQKLKILNETGQLSKNFLSFYAYKIITSLPPSIKIDQLNLFPLDKEIKENARVGIRANQLILKGSIANETVFNAWLSALKRFQWVGNFEIISLKKDKKYIQQFEVIIDINDV